MLKAINEIKEAKGNDKIKVMKAHPELKKVLEYAYNPFKKYYMSAPDLDGLDEYLAIHFQLFSNLFSLLDDLSSRKISGNKAFELVCDTIATLHIDVAEVFKMVLNKDLRCGINIKSINKAFPGLIPLVYDGSEKPPVMLLKTFDPKRVKYPCLAAVKKDGDRGLFVTEKIISRSGKAYTGMNHIEKELEFPVDGELCVPGLEFDEGSGLIRNNSQTPEAVLWIFDAPNIPGTKMERYNWLATTLKDSEHVKVIPHYKIKNQNALMNFYNWALKQGEEGIVIYDPDSEYEDKRSFDWMRLVPIRSADCPVIGFFEGKGKHVGSLGGIIVDYKGHEVRVGTGFPEKVKKTQENQLVSHFDKKLFILKSKKIEGNSIEGISPIWHKIRQFIWDNQELFKGVVAEIEFKEKTKAGSMRQPRFKNWRWDK